MITIRLRRLLSAPASILAAALVGLVRTALDHPLVIEPLDGSAASLWPHVAEEYPPARWPLPPV